MYIKPTILFEDSDIVVINKPVGVTVNRAETTKPGETIQEWHWGRLGYGEKGEGEFWDKEGIVHRLDRDTSGVMVLAKNQTAYEKLKLQFLERKTTKKYMALVYGKMKEHEGILALPIVRLPGRSGKFGIGDDPSRMAVTDWKVIEEMGDFSLVELIPHTGRTHQLRVHMKHLGHPIVGDPIYGFKKRMKADQLFASRLFLHAKYLEFTHPTSGKRIEFEAEIPIELKDSGDRIRQ